MYVRYIFKPASLLCQTLSFAPRINQAVSYDFTVKFILQLTISIAHTTTRMMMLCGFFQLQNTTFQPQLFAARMSARNTLVYNNNRTGRRPPGRYTSSENHRPSDVHPLACAIFKHFHYATVTLNV